MNVRIALLAAAAAYPCWDRATAASPAEFDPLVVTAARSEQPLSDTLAPLIVITRDEIERAQAGDIAELLRLHAGLDVGRNGGPGQATSLFMRGAESNHTLVLVDGVRVNPGTIGGAALQNIAPEQIERIEIIKGPRSSQWGADAIGGVVHIITRQPAPGVSGALLGRGGSFETSGGDLQAAYRNDRFDIGMNAHGLSTNGFPTRTASTIDAANDNVSANLRGGMALGDGRLSARHWDSRGTTEYLDFFLSPLSLDYRNSASALELETPLGPAARTRTTFSHVTDEIEQNEPNFLGDLDYAKTRRGGVETQGEWRFSERYAALAGAGAHREEADALSFGTRFDVHTDVWAAFAQGQFDAARHHVLAAARYTDHEAFGGHTSGHVEYGLDAWRDARIVAAAGTGFRAPDATDRFGFGGDPNLRPERSRNLELGLRQRLAETHEVRLAAFHNRIRDLIECVGGFPCTNVNVEEARIQGVEAGWRWQPDPWRVGLEAVVQDPINKTTGERLARRAGKSVTATMTRAFGPHGVGVDFLAQGRREDSAFSTTVNGGYGLLNLTGHWQLHPALRLQARLENVLDKQYETAAGFNTPDRSAYATLRYVFR